MRVFRCLLISVLLLFPIWCNSQQAEPVKGTTKTYSLGRTPDQVYAAALRVVRDYPQYTLVEHVDTTRTIRFRLGRAGSPGIGSYQQYLSSGIFSVSDSSVNGSTRAVLTMSIMNQPGTGAGTRRWTTLEADQVRRFYKLLEEELKP